MKLDIRPVRENSLAMVIEDHVIITLRWLEGQVMLDKQTSRQVVVNPYIIHSRGALLGRRTDHDGPEHGVEEKRESLKSGMKLRLNLKSTQCWLQY